MLTDSAGQSDDGKDRVDLYKGTYDVRYDRLVKGDRDITAKPVNAKEYLPYRRYSSTEVTHLSGVMAERPMPPFQFMGRLYNHIGLLPTSLYRADINSNIVPAYQQEFWARKIFHCLHPVNKDHADLLTPFCPQKAGYFPILPMQGVMQSNASGNGDWSANCLPCHLQQNSVLTSHDWGVVPRVKMGLKSFQTHRERMTVNVEKWKQFFWQMYAIPTPLLAHDTLKIDFIDNATKTFTIKTVNKFGKSYIKNSSYSLEQDFAVNGLRPLENSITENESDHRGDSRDKQAATDTKLKLSMKKRLASVSRKLFCCVLKD